MKRRGFVEILAATGSVAIFNKCKPPIEKIVPYVKPVEYIKPDKPVMYSSVYSFKNSAYGIAITTRNGKPIKIDGNENHPVNKGTSSHFIQTSLFDLYNPARFRKPVIKAQGSRDKAKGTKQKIKYIKHEINLSRALEYAKQKTITSVGQCRIIIDEHCSPTLDKIISEIESLYKNVKFVTYPAILTNEAYVNRNVISIDAELVPDFKNLSYIVSVGRDFLGTDKLTLYYQTQVAEKKKNERDRIRIITVESGYSLTGANSDKRIIIKPDENEHYLAGILLSILNKTYDNEYNEIKDVCRLMFNGKEITNEIEGIADDLISNKGKSLVWPDSRASAATIALSLCINYVLGNIGDGKPLNPKFHVPNSFDKIAGINELNDELENNKIETIIFGDTDVYYYTDERFKKLLSKIPIESRISLTYYNNGTEENSGLNIPLTHYVESWGDARTFDGYWSIRQPVIMQLNNNSISLEEFLFDTFLKEKIFPTVNTYYNYLNDNWLILTGSKEAWGDMLQKGVLNVPLQEQNFIFNFNKATEIIEQFYNQFSVNNKNRSTINNQQSTACILSPSYALYDGAFSENSFLSELPNPLTRAAWQSSAIVNENFAEIYNLKEGDVIEIKNYEGTLELPAVIIPSLADNTIVINFGYGKNSVNKNENAFRLVNREWTNFYERNLSYVNVEISKTGKHVEIPIIQKVEFIRDNPFVHSNLKIGGKKSVEPNENNKQSTINTHRINKWGMAIDLDLCTGCGACVVACQVENNIPVVGHDEIIKGRNMHWLRIDRYFRDNYNSAKFIPVMCQHCENAPCESVCPVLASTHSPEGLNETTYNRCIGSRYCIINCPYKVRRFNYYDYYKNFEKPLNYGLNPNVTVRSRGVVEKCSFCVQRINEAKYIAKDDGFEQIPDGSVKAACQQACPAGAITFGNLNNKTSEVSKKSDSIRAFHLLDELNTKPSIVYLDKITS